MNVLSPALGGAAGSIDGSGARSNSTDKSSNNGFDAMLNSKPATQKPAASKQASTDAKPASETRSEDGGSETTTEQSTATDSSTSNDDKPDTQTAAEDAPWPPFGLSAIVAQPTEPATQAPAALAAANQDEAAQANPAAALTALPAVATAASAKPATISADEASAELSLPLAAATASDDANNLNLDADTPAPTTFASLLHNQALQEIRASAPASSITAPTPTPDLNAGDFDEAIGARVGWLAEQKIGHAHIRINPENMGEIDVKLQLDGDRVHASFSSAHADVRHALESSLPRLREMLGEQGLQLSHADVGQQSGSQQQGDKGGTGSGLSSGNQLEGSDLPVTSSHNLRMRGLLDAYA